MLDIIAEPKDKTYIGLLQLAMQHCSSFSLTWRDQLKFNESASQVMSFLSSSLISEAYTNEWPGTILLSQKATVRYYHLTKKTLKTLAEAPSLYAWLSPDFPEDIAFYRSDETCWLFSIAHAKEAAILDAEITIDDLIKAVPNLKVKKV